MFEWIRQGRVSGELYRGRWHNLGTPMQLAQLDAELRASSPGAADRVGAGISCVAIQPEAW